MLLPTGTSAADPKREVNSFEKDTPLVKAHSRPDSIPFTTQLAVSGTRFTEGGGGGSSTYGVASEVVSFETVLGNPGAFRVLKLHESNVTADMDDRQEGMHQSGWVPPEMRLYDDYYIELLYCTDLEKDSRNSESGYAPLSGHVSKIF